MHANARIKRNAFSITPCALTRSLRRKKMEHQAVVLHLTLDQLDYGMAHGHGQPRWHNERLLRRLAAIDGHGRLGEDRFYATRAAP
ncbi:hypothetical protein [Xanthomonas arboricola]|uniref:hypothetical protein n=1 Tax=Xanthomonas arboricola TaxID=56448 RepID=UPI0011B004C1|nr:hypothetical protein [Xanthomonas arboricola]